MFSPYARGVKVRQSGDFRVFAWCPAQAATIENRSRIIFPHSYQVYSIGSFCLNNSNFKSYKMGGGFLHRIILYF
jgi:hypothetical protein